jgi:long-chain acyl-CoA synthetase
MSLLPELLRAQAARRGKACALLDGDGAIDYSTLEARALRIAAGLRGMGVARGDRVAVVLPNSHTAVAVIYGVWLAGAVVVPLNAQARAREIAALSTHVEARAIVCDEGYRERADVEASVESFQIRIVTTAELLRDSATANESGQAVVATDLAMILYTSGTTGAPKGVMLSHGNLAANVSSIVEYLALTSDDKVLSVLPFYYAYGFSVLHSHLAVGGCVVIERNFVFPHVVIETMARTGVTGFSGVPSTFALLVSRMSAGLGAGKLPALRYITQAGAAMSPALVAKVRAALPHAKLYVMYGQTEATARLTYVPPGRLEDKAGSVGIAIPGVEIEIRDGEVWARGANIMQGYWRNEAATRAALKDGWLRTGDIGYLDQEGFLFLEGRRSDIIKTGANRVHPGEIEEVVAELAGVAEVAAGSIDDEILGQAIVVCVVRDTASTLSTEHIKAHCRARLPGYKVPKAVRFVSALPRTESGKVRRFELATVGEKETA